MSINSEDLFTVKIFKPSWREKYAWKNELVYSTLGFENKASKRSPHPSIFTDRTRSMGEVMLSQASVCPQGGVGVWYRGGGYLPRGGSVPRR